MKLNLYFLTLLLPFLLWGQGHITGTITADGLPLENASVFFENTTLGTSSDFDGKYSLSIAEGTHLLNIQAIGFATVKQQVRIEKDATLSLNFSLKEDVLGLDQIVVSATRRHLNKRTAPVVVTVTDSKIFKATQSISLSEGMNFQPGLRIETNCQNCGFSQIKMNGLDGAYSQILIDSRPVFSALNSIYGLDQIPTNTVERIEVVRGGGSALFGSNAIAGTINIITKDPTTNGFQIGSHFGAIHNSAFDKATTFNGTLVSEDFDTGIAVFGMYRNREPLDYDRDGYTELTRMENKSFGFKAFYKTKERNKITLEFHTLHEFRRGGNHLDLQPFEANISEQIASDVVTGGLTYEFKSQNLKHSLSFYSSASFSKNQNYYGGRGQGNPAEGFENTLLESLDGFGNSRDNTWVFGGQYTYDFEKFLGGSGTFTGGLEYKYDDMEDNKPTINALIAQTLKIFGVYVQQEWKIDERIKLLGGLRVDAHNLTNQNRIVNPRFTALYNVTESLRVRTSFAKGYRAPQVFTEDVHASLAAGELSRILVPKMTLKTENSDSYLASLDWETTTTLGALSLSLEGFYTHLKNPFVLVAYEKSNIDKDRYPKPNEGMTWVKENGDNARVKGVNFELKYSPNKIWLVQLGATLQESKYDQPQDWSSEENNSDKAAAHFFKSPNAYGNFVLGYAPTKRFQNNLSGVYTGSMLVPHLAGAPENPTEDRLENTPSFFELNLKSSYLFDLDAHEHLGMEVSIGVQNLLDSYQKDFDTGPLRDANYVYGPTRPRTCFVGLKFGTNL